MKELPPEIMGVIGSYLIDTDNMQWSACARSSKNFSMIRDQKKWLSKNAARRLHTVALGKSSPLFCYSHLIVKNNITRYFNWAKNKPIKHRKNLIIQFVRSFANGLLDSSPCFQVNHPSTLKWRYMRDPSYVTKKFVTNSRFHTYFRAGRHDLRNDALWDNEMHYDVKMNILYRCAYNSSLMRELYKSLTLRALVN